VVGHMVQPHSIVRPGDIQQLVYGDAHLHIFLTLLSGLEPTERVLVGVG
jgi:hypothetical protein